ncbi:MAG: 6-carboxytetrahydropterin synthase [Litorivicinaceae bacterium]|nr:6-carboxytetrahydropterin synthase [Litorivicinus sp.]RZO82481.1 MAG: 6-carboxytetrahydropterin synthase [Litorivicinaceae bacterium]HBC48151.1 6-pyruvoyl tetrahydropterin synthase [Gammaproteobacteria bacterium]
MSVYQTIKTFDNFPCSHRQWRHSGHCKFIHGYSRSFKMTFGCKELTESGFGVDFGEFSEIKSWLSHWFDHTLLINEDDPERALFQELHEKQIVDLRVLPNVSMERTAEFVFHYVDGWIRQQTHDRSFLLEVECRENDKNAGVYRPATH